MRDNISFGSSAIINPGETEKQGDPVKFFIYSAGDIQTGYEDIISAFVYAVGNFGKNKIYFKGAISAANISFDTDSRLISATNDLDQADFGDFCNN